MESGKDLSSTTTGTPSSTSNPKFKPPAITMSTRPKNSKPLNPSFYSRHYCCFHFCISFLQYSKHPPSSPYSIVKTPKKQQQQQQQPNSTPHLIISTLFLLLLSLLFIAFFAYTGKLPTSVHRKKYLEIPSFDLTETAMVPLPVRDFLGNNCSDAEREFWQQNNGGGLVMGYRRPRIVFSLKYRKASRRIVAEKRRFLVVVASGGLNQQRNQIVDAVVISRILGAALVVPFLKANAVWGDESKFSEIFDVDHFKRTLRSDIRVVEMETLPDSYKILTKSVQNQISFKSSPFLIRRILQNQLNRDGVITLSGLDSELSKRLNVDLQKLRCKVSFHALRFNPRIHALGNRLARRMWDQGPYVAIHLRLEKDVWVRTGCLPGLGPELDQAIIQARHSHPELLTARLAMSPDRRKLSGLCPLTAHEVARFLKAMGVPDTARLYLAGGEPYGGEEGVVDLTTQFPNSITKETLAKDGELNPYVNSSSALAALDFMVALSSDVFIASHGGNMGRSLQGYRSYCSCGVGGRRKVIKPNKRGLAVLFANKLINEKLSEEEIGVAVRRMHSSRKDGDGGGDEDVIANPAAACMCPSGSSGVFDSSLEL